MGLNRRSFVLGSAAMLVTSASADDRQEYIEYPFKDYFRADLRGRDPSRAPDIEAANRIAASMPSGDHFHTMQALSGITEVGTTSEVFNERWKKFANPLIVRFFHDIGYARTPYPGDCTPWCAATLSWCLKRAGHSLPRDPASSQSFRTYGRHVEQSDATPGDICVFGDIGDPAHGHVGLLVSRNGDMLSVLGGNQSGGSETNCGPGYRQSKIKVSDIHMNPQKDRRIGIHFFRDFRRPT